MSALPPKAEMDRHGCDVRFVPKADIEAPDEQHERSFVVSAPFRGPATTSANSTVRENDHGNLCRARQVHRSSVKNAKESPKRAEAFRQMAETFGVTVKDLF